MADEIEEFIRRAAERRKQQGQRKPPPKAPPPPVRPPAAPPTIANKPRTPLASTLFGPPVVEAEIVSAQVVDEVSAHVASHLSTQQFTERASHLGEETALADDRLEAHLHQKFDHQLGTLTRSTMSAPATVTSGPAPTLSPSAVVEMLRSPQQIRNAIILSEVLARPDHQW